MRRSPVGWVLPAIAGGAATLAILEGAYLELAIPAATVAVIAASLMIVGGWTERADEEAAPPAAEASGVDRIHRSLRASLQSGRLGREDIVAVLDRIERRFLDPQLPPRSVEELESLSTLPSGEFLAYVRGRLDRLEASV